MNNLAKNLFFRTLILSGVERVFRHRNRRRALILTYHNVVRKPQVPFCWSALSEKSFLEQIRFLKKYYNVIHLSSLVDMIRSGKPLEETLAAITFDDGFMNNYEIAYPILKQYNCPATIFVNTGNVDHDIVWTEKVYLMIRKTNRKVLDLRPFGMGLHDIRTAGKKDAAKQYICNSLKQIPVDKKDFILVKIKELLGVDVFPLDKDFRTLTWKAIEEMYNSGLVDFGAHTVNHEILPACTDDKMRTEIFESSRALKEKLHKKSLVFSYPNGNLDKRALPVFQKSGVKSAVSCREGLCRPNEDLFDLPRISIASNTSIARFRLLTSEFIFSFKKLFTYRDVKYRGWN